MTDHIANAGKMMSMKRGPLRKIVGLHTEQLRFDDGSSAELRFLVLECGHHIFSDGNARQKRRCYVCAQKSAAREQAHG
jgi:hypothetical protein